MGLLLQSLGSGAAAGAANLASLCRWACHLAELASEPTQSDADVSAPDAPYPRIIAHACAHSWYASFTGTTIDGGSRRASMQYSLLQQSGYYDEKGL